MRDFIDLTGASGAQYRFRLWPQGAGLPPMAGNYVILKVGAEGEGFTILLAGATNDLSRARADWAKVANRGATDIFMRFNVARAVRMTEHLDLVAAYKPAVVREVV